tara:strand:+ start:29 stop:1183 length:1155 start_codon:yes stop_codon:yes gene_type:complete
MSFGGKVSSEKSLPKKTGLITLPASTNISLTTKPYHVFGVRGKIRDNVDYISETKLVYPVGKRICTYSIEKKKTEFIDLHSDVEEVVGLTVAPNRKRIACCELSSAENGTKTTDSTATTTTATTNITEGKEGAHQATSPRGGLNPKNLKSQVSVYHALQGVHLRTLSLPNMKGIFTNCAFTSDNKFLIAIGSAPDYKLVYWKWSNMKMISSVSMSSQATRIRMNPNNSAQITTSGPNHLKLWTLEKDLSLKCSSLLPQKKEKAEVFVDHAWTKIGSTNNEGGENHGFILTATEKGVILVLQLNEEGHSEIRQTINLFAATRHAHHHQKIHTIQSYAKGFVVGGSNGYFAVYEQTDDQKDPFLPIRAFETNEKDTLTTVGEYFEQ